MSRSSDDDTSRSRSDTDTEKRRSKKKSKEMKRKKSKKKSKHSKREKERKIENRDITPTHSTMDTEAAFGPALPPNFLQNEKITNPVIGPILPSVASIASKPTEKCEKSKDVDDDDDDDDDLGNFGPLPQDNAKQMTATQIELEERALALKLAQINGGTLTTVDQTTREEWMLELPEVGLKGGLAALDNLKRAFYQGRAQRDFSDRSDWTKTPQTAGSDNITQVPKCSKDLEQSAAELHERQRNEEQEDIVRKHRKKHKREKSLVEIHKKKLHKEKRKKEKELAAQGLKPERRPFSRDVDLKLNKIDSQQTKKIVDKAKILNTKFSSGSSKFL